MMDDGERFQEWKRRPCRETMVALFRGLQASVYNLCYSVLRHPQDAEDAAQRVFVELLGVLERLDSLDGLRAWLYRASILTALNLRRSERRRRRHEQADRPEPASSLSPADLEAIHEHIAALEADLRSLVVRHYFERQTLEELARSGGCSTVAVWKRLEKARDTLRQSLLQAGLASGAAAMAAFLDSREAVAAPSWSGVPEAVAVAGGAVVKAKVALIALAVGLLGVMLLGVGMVRRSRGMSADAVALVPIPKTPRGPLLSRATKAAAPVEEAAAIADEPVRRFRTGNEFLAALHQTLALRDDRECWKALRRMGIRRSDKELQSACARTGKKRVMHSSTTEMLRSLLNDWMRSEPAACATFITSLPKDWTMDANLVWSAGAAVVDWSKEDPRAARAFLVRIPTTYKISEFMKEIEYRIRFREDPPGFLAWFQSLPSGGFKDLEALKLAVPYWADQDNRSLVSWAEKLPENYCKSVLQMTATVWGEPESAGSPWTQKCVEILRTAKDFNGAVRAVVDEFVRGVAETDADWAPERAAKWDAELFRPLLLKLLGRRAGEDPGAAARYVESLPFDPWSICAVDAVAVEWGRKEPVAALDWLLSRGFASVHGGAAWKILTNWVSAEGTDPQAMMAVVEGLPEPLRKQMRTSLVSEWAQIDPAAAIRFAESAPAGAFSSSPIPAIAGSWAHDNFDAALQWTRTIALEADRDQAFIAVADTQIHQMDQALAVLREIHDDAKRNSQIEHLIYRAARGDPSAASKALGALANPSPSTYTEIARCFGNQDPQEGLSWAQSLPPERQIDAVRMILLTWGNLRGGGPARQWVEASSLAPELKEEMLRNLRRK